LRRREAIWCYVFIAPAVLGVLIFAIGPMIASLWLSFTSYDMLSSPEFIGVKNYTKLISDKLYTSNSQKILNEVFGPNLDQLFRNKQTPEEMASKIQEAATALL
jgi:ABC-type sugar transport system permease subunit